MANEIDALKLRLQELANSYKTIKAGTTTAPVAAAKEIKQSVGEGGKNDPADVTLVQKLLNAKYKLGVGEDGKIGPKTIAAIKQFQLKVVKIEKPDGRIDPGGKSWKTLSAGTAPAPVVTPPTPVVTPPVATVTPTSGMITGAVGEGGANVAADVAAVQALFNKNHKKTYAVDGKVTPELIAAIKALQSANGSSKPDGRIDPNGKTWGYLNAAASTATAPPSGGGKMEKPSWLAVAEGEKGVSEIKGAKHSPRVVEYHSTTGGFRDDETPWCSSFVNWVMKKDGQATTNNAMAMSWAKYGKKLDKPAYGAIVVFSYGGGKGHVGFVVGKKGSNILVLGGNQGDMVKVSSFGVGKVAAYVVPANYTVPAANYAFGEAEGDFETADFNSTR